MTILAYLHQRARRKGLLDAASSVARRFEIAYVSRALAEIARLRQTLRPAAAAFRGVQIETLAYCNLKCSFCPTNSIDMPKGRMSASLFDHLIDQLRDFDGTLGLYLRNEPLLDKRIVAFARQARERTKARIVIQTNGVLLTETLAGALSEVAEVQVNDYSGGRELQRLAPVLRRFGMVGLDRSDPRGLSNRAGNLPGAEVPVRALDAFCVRPFEQLYVAYDGRVVLCCQDWRLEEVMGDARNTPLAEIWQGEAYQRKRAELMRRSREGLCAACDFPGV